MKWYYHLPHCKCSKFLSAIIIDVINDEDIIIYINISALSPNLFSKHISRAASTMLGTGLSTGM